MADPKRVARALQYQQDKPAWWDAVPVADAPGTVRAPTPQEMSWLDRLNELSAGAGKGIESQLEGYKNMVLHPVDTAQQMYQSGKAVVQDPSLLVKGLQAMGERAMSSPQGFGEVVGENISPRNLLRNLARPSIEELTVYHGTPHRFPATERNPLGEFDASKIGTGEGAQAYGHGLYLAESPDVAGSYVRPNPIDVENLARISGLGQLSREAQVELRRAANISEKSADAAAKTAQNASRELRGVDSAGIAKVINQIRSDSKGSLYHVDLPDEMIDKMLDWDKPLIEQHPEVQKIIGDEIKRIGGSAHTGESAYKELMFDARMNGITSDSPALRNNVEAAAASRRLQELGIPGIRYLDAGSRGAEKGTRNFVIFPGEERNLKILERK